MGFHTKTQNPSSFKVLNKFGSLLPLILLLTWGCCYCLLSFFFSLGAATLLLLPVFSFWAKFRQLATQKKKKPSATSTKNVFCENFQNIRHIS
jgi:hypothetical protein